MHKKLYLTPTEKFEEITNKYVISPSNFDKNCKYPKYFQALISFHNRDAVLTKWNFGHIDLRH